MFLSPYRPRDGWLIRRAFFVMAVAFGAFAAYRMYLWAKAYRWLLADVSVRYPLNWGQVGGALVLAGVFFMTYYFIFMRRSSVDFLVEVERELREVAWPEYRPIGSPKAELWGSTYIVIGVVLVMTVFVGLVDFVYQALAQFVFYR